MVRRVDLELVDDLDGGKADQTVYFGLDDRQYQIDLSTSHEVALRLALAPYRLAGRQFRGEVAVHNPLTARERSVLGHVSYGATNEETANSLGISRATVKTYLERAQAKLHSSDRTSTVAAALRRGWI